MRKDFDSCSVFTSCIWQTTTTVVQQGDQLFLFDPAYFPEEIEQIAAYLKQIGADRRLVLVITHGDWDHIAAFPPFADAFVIAHQAVADSGRREQQIELADDFDRKYYVNRPYRLEITRIDRFIAADEEMAGWGVRFLPVPGHTADMIATFFPDKKLLVAGDMLSDLEFPFVYHDSSAYLESLKKVERLTASGMVEQLVPGHGSPAIGTAEIMRRIIRDVQYLEEARKLVFSGVRQGVDRERLASLFAQLQYDHQPIPQHLASQHQENFEFIYAEAEDLDSEAGL